MKKVLKRIGALVVFLMLLASLFACNSNVNMELSAKAEKVVSTDEIKFVNDDGTATFRIVRPDSIDEFAGPAAISIYKKYKEAHGTAPKQCTDEGSGENVREIIVGNCDRDAVTKAKELLAEDGTGKDSDFIICSIDDDVVILGNCGQSLEAAVEYFTEKILSAELPDGIYYHHKGKEEGVTVCNISEISKFTVVRPIYNVSYLTQTETDKLCDVLYAKTGYNVPIVHDNISKNNPNPDQRGGLLEKTPVNEYEIIIGNCDREGVSQIKIAYNYEIRIEDKKIYLNGGSPYATAMAVSEFVKMVENNKTIDGSMSVLNGNYNDSIKNYDRKTQYRPTWYDEFNGTEIDEKKWRVAWDAKSDTSVDGKPCYRGSSKLKNNYVKDGKLYIEAVKTEDAYYGGMLKTDTTMEFLYGYLEISDLHPKGKGFWTALWTVSKSNKYNKEMWYSETDIDESFGSGDLIKGNLWAWPTSYGRNMLNLHSGRSDTVKNHGEYTTTDPRGLWQDFHTYGLEWVDNKTIRFTVDGYVWRETELQEEELQKVYSQYMIIQISMATAFETLGLVTQDEWEWQNTNKFVVDWIYLYQKDGHGLLRHK